MCVMAHSLFPADQRVADSRAEDANRIHAQHVYATGAGVGA